MRLEQIYTECNNHLREIDKNRNQTINFYLVAIGAYIAFLDNFSQDIQLIMISLLLFILGVIQALNLIDHRKWHTRYSFTARLLTVLSKNKPSNYTQVERKQRALKLKELGIHENKKFLSRAWLKSYLLGTEFKTYNAFLVIAFIPIGTLILFLRIKSGPIIGGLDYILMILILIIYGILLNFIAALILFNAHSKSPWADWLLDGILRTKEN
jgi:hypothetical protein